LIDDAIEEYEENKNIYNYARIELDVINKKLSMFLQNKRGFMQTKTGILIKY